MYNFLQQFMNYSSRNGQSHQPMQRTRSNIYPGASLFQQYNLSPSISTSSVVHSRRHLNEPIFRTNIEVTNDSDTTRDFEDREELSLTSHDINYDVSSSFMNDINHIAEIVDGNHDATYYMNFPNENANDDSNTLFYTVFESGVHRIQYHHDNVLTREEGNSIYDHILNLLENENNDLESTLHASFQSDDNYHRENSMQEIESMKTAMIEEKYCVLSSILKNDVCPIEYQKFNAENNVCMFTTCNHGISASHIDNYLKTFKKCPLCNTPFVKN